jgi:hypothetical protein
MQQFTKRSTIDWRFYGVNETDPPTIVRHRLVESPEQSGNLIAQITMRIHSKQVCVRVCCLCEFHSSNRFSF